MADKRDYYEVLGLSKGASDDELTLPQLKQWDSCFNDSYLHIVNYMPERAVSTSYIYTVSVMPYGTVCI